MEDTQQQQFCPVCLTRPSPAEGVVLACGHLTCSGCLREYLRVLKLYRQFTPEKLRCLFEGCSQEIEDSVLLRVFPGEEGYVLKTIKRCYKDSKNPAAVVFGCPGLMGMDRKPLLVRGDSSREEYSRRINEMARQLRGKEGGQHRSCNNILTYVKGTVIKEGYIQCYVCSCTLCLGCLDVSHAGKCEQLPANPLVDRKTVQLGDNFQQFLSANQMRRCLNGKCGLPIAKEEGCYWVKCRCSWEMCYPCGKMWGDCPHFSQYPYQKFTPPAEWLVKALNML